MALRICAAAGKVAFVRHSQAEKVVASYWTFAATGDRRPQGFWSPGAGLLSAI